MKLKTEIKAKRKKSRPFLVLPFIEHFTFKSRDSDCEKMPKNTGLKLFTKTWPPKRENNEENDDEKDRPLTATLDKPTILNISLMGIIDMTTVRKEFLNISNLCKFPLSLPKRRKTALVPRPLSLPSPQKKKNRKKRPETSEDSWEEEESSSVVDIKSKEAISRTKLKMIEDAKHKKTDANNNKAKKMIPLRKRVGVVSKVLNVKSDVDKSTKLPEPCKTCGRPDLPERFHSHPVTPLKNAKKQEETPKSKWEIE